MSETEFDFEGAFGSQLEHKEAPRLNQGLNDERRIVQPQERLAAWLVRGYGILLFPTLLLLALLADSVYTIPAFLPVTAVMVLLIPSLGERPIATPGRILIAAAFLAVSTSFATGLSRAVFDSIYDYDGGFRLYHLAENFQIYLEKSTTPGVTIPVLVLGISLFGLGKWLLARYPWIDSRLQIGKAYKWMSFSFFGLVASLLILPPLYLEWRVSQLDWVVPARQAAAPSNRGEYREGEITFEQFEQFRGRLSPYQRKLLKEMSDQEVLKMLAVVNSSLEDAAYQPTTKDNFLFHRLFERIATLESPSPVALKYLVLIQRLSRESGKAINTVNFGPALLAQSQLLIELQSEKELDNWSQLIAAPELPPTTQEDLDRLALETINNPAFGRTGDRGRADHNLTLFGLNCGPSLKHHLKTLESNVFLLDYSARRENELKKGEHPYRRLMRGAPATVWPEPNLDNFYQELYRFSEENAGQEDTELLQALISLRQHKLKNGVYPETSPLGHDYSYTCLGEEAVLSTDLPPESFKYQKWILR